MTRPLLRDDLLFSIWSDPDHSAARIRGPEGAVRFGQDTFRALQITANVLDRRLLNPKIQNRILYQSFISKLSEFSHCFFRLPIGALICIAQQLPNRFRDLAYLPGSDAVALLGEA